MNMLADTIAALSLSPWAWGVVGALGLWALSAVWQYRTCPFLNHRARRPGAAEARTMLAQPRFFGPSYALMLLGALIMLLGGLGLIATEAAPLVGFSLLAIGLYVAQTAPVKLRLREAALQVQAAEGRPAERELALERMRVGHLWHIAISLAVVAALAIGLLAF